MGYTYILRCADDTLYVGSTRDLHSRMQQHHEGLGAIYTSTRLPVFLLWYQEFERIDEAYAMEKRIQGWSHGKREALIYGGIEAVKGWSARERKKRAG